MTAAYRTFFGLTREPFPADLDLGDIYQTSDLSGVLERFEYAVRLGGMALVTGDIGAGKSTALRYAASTLHPSQYRVFYLTASSGSILEFYRLVLGEMGLSRSSNSKAFMARLIKQ